MSVLASTPRTFKGALVTIDITGGGTGVVPFQYNPETLTRTLRVRGAEGGRAEATRLGGAPEENIRIDAELDATDALERGDASAARSGIYPLLSALEMLVYPSSALVIANAALLAVGIIEVVPPVGPLTLFIWGVRRVLPVRVAEFSIVEEAHDEKLNPIRAKVSLGLRVLSYEDLPITHPGYHLFLAHHVVKETMAAVGRVNGLSAVAGADLRLF